MPHASFFAFHHFCDLLRWTEEATCGADRRISAGKDPLLRLFEKFAQAANAEVIAARHSP